MAYILPYLLSAFYFYFFFIFFFILFFCMSMFIFFVTLFFMYKRNVNVCFVYYVLCLANTNVIAKKKAQTRKPKPNDQTPKYKHTISFFFVLKNKKTKKNANILCRITIFARIPIMSFWAVIIILKIFRQP